MKETITFLFAHGAGAGMDSEFMLEMAELISDQGIKVVRFEFDYMEERRKSGSKRPPDRQPKLLARFDLEISNLVETDPKQKIFIGGKSMGGRMATLLATEDSYASTESVQGIICMGYPFHPPGKPEKLRTEHLKSIKTPTLILQGERDTFGTKEEVPNYPLAKTIQTTWLADGDHSLKPRKKSGVLYEENMKTAADAAVEFMKKMAN